MVRFPEARGSDRSKAARALARRAAARALASALAGVLGVGAAGLACAPAPESSSETAAARGDDGAEAPALEPTGVATQVLEGAPVWTVTGAMTQARQLFVSSLLGDGRVLVAGGWRVGAIDTGNVYFASAELYDPAAGSFTALPFKMAKKRVEHAAAPFPGGRVLVVGGYGDEQSATTAEVFVPSIQKFQSLSTLAHQRVAATLTVLDGGDLLAAGGDEAPGRTAEILDPATMTWTLTAPMIAHRRSHTATLLAGGRVLVAGGRRPDDADNVTATAELYDPATGTWKPAASMSVARAAHTATRLATGHVLVTGGFTTPATAELGATAELYDPGADAWTSLPSMEQARALHTATLLANGAVLVAGGIDETSSVARTTELFDPVTLRWVSVGLMSHGRLAHTALLLADGAVLAAGGEHQSSAEIYRAAADGQPCELDPQCASGHCVEGVCCNDACTGACSTCLLPDALGTCSLAALGTDPHDDCGAGGPCDDVCGEGGVCTDRVGAVCVAPACNEDGTHAILQATCAASGDACPETTVDCTPYLCGEDGDDGAPGCRSSCESIDDCAAGFACAPDGTCRTRPDVAAADPEACAVYAPPSSSSSSSSSRVPFALVVTALALALVAARRSARRPS